MIKLILGDSKEKLKDLEENSVDSIVTDPPYGISFMGKKWDYDVPSTELWKEVFRVLKPGGHLLSFGGSRTYHRMVVNIEDAGFEIRDQIMWIYGSGFPKSHNISKGIDKVNGQDLTWFIEYILKIAEERGITRNELTMLFPSKNGKPTGWLWNKQKSQGITLEQYNKIKDFLDLPFSNIEEAKRTVIGRGSAGLTKGTIANFAGSTEFDITESSTDLAKQWDGWGTALKPAHEPIVMARKPLSENNIVQNVLKHGTGGINIDESRVKFQSEKDLKSATFGSQTDIRGDKFNTNRPSDGHVFNKNVEANPIGRFPANVIHDGSKEVTDLFPETTSGKVKTDKSAYSSENNTGFLSGNTNQDNQHGDSGNASRFFYCPKTSKTDRNEGLDEFEENYELNNNTPDDILKEIMKFL